MPKCVEEMKGIPDPEELSSAISEFLQIIEVKCEMFDKVVLNILKFLSKLGISKPLLTHFIFLQFSFTCGKESK